MPGSGGKHRAVASAKNVGAGTKTPTALTLRVPLTELLRGGDVARTLLLLLLLALTAPSAAPLRSSTPTTSTSATPASASTASAAATTAATSATSTTTATTAATPASTAATSTPTPATTSTATPTPSAASTSTSTAPTGPTRSLAPLALARAASPTRGRRRTDRLKTTEVGRSGRGDRGQERGRRTPLKDGGAGVTSRGSYSDYALLCCKEGLLEAVDCEGGGTDREEVVPDYTKGVREAKHCPESTLIVLPHECPYCCRYTVFRAAPLARSSCPAPPAIALPCPAHDRAALPCPQSRCLLPSALPARERASCPRAPLRPCPLALPASSLRPVVCCYCCHLRGPSCYMRCCYYLLLLLSATAAAEHAAVATAAASIPAAVPELLLPNALLLLLLLQVVLLLRLSCCRYPRCLHVPSPRAAAAAAVRRLLRAAAAATCCSCRSLLLLLLTAAAFAATAIAPCPARAVSPCRAAPPCQFAAATAIAAAATTATAAMANFSVLMFDAEWLMRDATARNHLPVAERASESAAFDETLHTFTLDSGASRCFFRDCTTLTPLAAPVPVSLADPTGGPKVARASTVLPCPAIPSDSLSGLHLPTFSTKLVSNATLQDVWTLLWHHRLGHPSLPRLRSMHSRLLVSGLPRSLPSLPRSPAPPCLPCVEGRQRAAPHSSKFPPTTAPLQTLHMDDLPVLRLHSDRGGEFSFDLLAELCQDKGIHRTFTLPTSPQQNGIAERRFSLIMEVARTSMIHAAAPHFLWPFAV
ncbi:unnamed protein product [Closterium sp. NIES-54]